MQKKILIALIIALILLTCTWYGYGKYSEYQYNREIVIAGSDREGIAIYIEPDDTATRASANYLAFTMEQTFGAKAEIVTEQNEDYCGIRILCGTEIPETEQKKAVIEFVTAAEAAGDTGDAVYSVRLDQTGVSIFIPERENCFGAVKAVTDRWFQKDCGLESGDELRISQALVDQKLSGLSTEITGVFRVLTQNLRYCDDDNGRSVEERAARFAQLVKDYQPDLIGGQECTRYWLELLQQSLGDRYGFYGCSSSGPGASDGWYNIVLYRKDRFTVLDGETFWLSNTPSEPDTKLNYDGISRICTWALMQDNKTEQKLLLSNTHLHAGAKYTELRERQAEILMRRLRKEDNKLERFPGFLIGDFNSSPEEPFYPQIINYYEDSRSTAITNSSKIDYSFHNYGASQLLLDYCFHSPKNVTVLDYRILTDEYDGYISDHYGILVTAILN